MLKLVKILNSRTNVPEPIIVNCNGADEFVKGSLYYMGETEIKKSSSTTFDTPIIALESIPQRSGKKTLLCYVVTPDMVFETDFYPTENNKIYHGDILDYMTDDNDSIIGVTDVGGQEARVFALPDDNGKILITIYK